MLTPGREEDYVGFLKVRKTPVQLLSEPKISISDEEAQRTIDQIRQFVLEDKALHDLAQRGFPSWVKAYSKHQASSIFRVADLQWGELGHAWGLLKLPSMPELKKWNGDRKLGLNVDFEAYTYKDKQRERHRLEELSLKRNAQPNPEGSRKKPEVEAWSQKKDQKNVKVLRREKKLARRDVERMKKMTATELDEKKELVAMIAKVREREKKAAEEEFTGFSD